MKSGATHIPARLLTSGAVLIPALLALGCARSAPPVVAPPAGPVVMTPELRRSMLVDTVKAVLQRALADRAFPGAIAVVGNGAGAMATVSVGTIDWGSREVPTERTLWDLASLTKVVGTTSAVMHLVAREKVFLDVPLGTYLPRWRGRDWHLTTPRHLLTHTGGLRAFRPLYRETEDAYSALSQVYVTEADTAPGMRMVYSDLGFILLAELVRNVSGEPVDRYLQRNVFGPLGMTETMFRPDTGRWPGIPPTELDPWRGRLVKGEVHDENAFRLGGVAGHAGLFSTARDLTRFARMYLNGGELDGVRVFPAEVIERFTLRQEPAFSTRALGWDVTNGRGSGGSRLSPVAFGHTGFTGTSIWIDPEQDLFVLLLSNRVNPTRENSRIGRVRTELADAAVSVLTRQ